MRLARGLLVCLVACSHASTFGPTDGGKDALASDASDASASSDSGSPDAAADAEPDQAAPDTGSPVDSGPDVQDAGIVDSGPDVVYLPWSAPCDTCFETVECGKGYWSIRCPQTCNNPPILNTNEGGVCLAGLWDGGYNFCCPK